MAGVASLALELTSEPRLTGSDQSEKLGAAVSDDTSKATRPMAAAAARKTTMTVLLWCRIAPACLKRRLSRDAKKRSTSRHRSTRGPGGPGDRGGREGQEHRGWRSGLDEDSVAGTISDARRAL